MRKTTYIQAINEAIKEEMRRDESVFLIGEDVGHYGGLFRVTRNLMDEFGVVAEKVQVGESALSYLMDHTASVFLIGPDGRLQAQYLYGTDYRDILHDVERIFEAA